MNGQNANILPFMNAEHGQLWTCEPSATALQNQADNIEFAPVTQAFTATLYYAVPGTPYRADRHIQRLQRVRRRRFMTPRRSAKQRRVQQRVQHPAA